MSYAHGGWFAYGASLLLIGGVAGFLPFNFPRARIFMGDVGSQFCGFMLAVLAVVASRFEGVELSFLLVPMLLSGVLFDVAFTLVRRWHAGERLTAPHRGHLYQVAQRTGIPAIDGRAGALGLRAVRRAVLPGLHRRALGPETVCAAGDSAAAVRLAARCGAPGRVVRDRPLGVRQRGGWPPAHVRPGTFGAPARRTRKPPARWARKPRSSARVSAVQAARSRR